MKKIIYIILLLLPIVSYSQDTLTICKDNSISYKEFTPPNSLSTVAWEWTLEGGIPSSSVMREPSNINYPIVGIFKTTCISTFSNGAKDTNYIFIKVISSTFNPIPIQDTLVCDGVLDITLDSYNSGLGHNFLWTSTTGGIPGDFYTGDKLKITKPGEYNVRVFSNCGSVTQTFYIKYNPFPEFEIIGEKTVCKDSLTLYIVPDTSPIYKFEWNTGDTTSYLIVSTPGYYSLQISDTICNIQNYWEYEIESDCPPIVFIPNVFSPNNDGYNDYYKPYVEGYSLFRMDIYNRWGELIFISNNSEHGWDGTFQTKECQQDIYNAFFILVDNNQRSYYYKTLIYLNK